MSVLGGIFLLIFSYSSASHANQMGDTWDRTPFKNLSSVPAPLQNILIPIALVKTSTMFGTAFYVGQIQNELVMVTNHHVMPMRTECEVKFKLIDGTTKCKRFLGTWKNLELTLFTVASNFPATKKLTPLPLSNAPLVKGRSVLLAGYGLFQNKRSRLTADSSENCKIFSEKLRDITASTNYKALSLAHGCEASQGDSGAPIIDQITYDVVGLHWATTASSKTPILPQDFLNKLFNLELPEIWKNLSYAVPSNLVLEKIRTVL